MNIKKNILPCIKELVANAKAAIDQALDIPSLDKIRVEYLGRMGYLTRQIRIIRELLPEERPMTGAIVNRARDQIQQALNIRKIELENAMLDSKLTTEIIDISLPGRRTESGSLHPITHIINRVEEFFNKLGFTKIIGPEIEDDYHNFDALNISIHHPARTDYDTFWFDSKRLLRTQTSCVQIRAMEVQSPPIRIIAPGRVYRNDYDQTHTPMFHQIEGLIIDRNISFSNLKNMLHNFLYSFFKRNIQIRFRPSYFPFTEPSIEVDIMSSKNSKWLEVLGCGMVHPDVLNRANIDPEIYSGFAFGMGVERLAMLFYDITDLRIFFENDLRFLKQFK